MNICITVFKTRNEVQAAKDGNSPLDIKPKVQYLKKYLNFFAF